MGRKQTKIGEKNRGKHAKIKHRPKKIFIDLGEVAKEGRILVAVRKKVLDHAKAPCLIKETTVPVKSKPGVETERG